MKMAKADNAEWQKCMDFANGLEERVQDLGDAHLGRWVRENYVWLGRTLFGYRVLVDNCCDPAQSTLEWKPEIAAAIAAYKVQQQANNDVVIHNKSGLPDDRPSG